MRERLHMLCGLPYDQHMQVRKDKKIVWLCPDEQAQLDPDLDPYRERVRPSGRPAWEEE